jgi:cell shape-determining protein MreC
MKNSKLALRVFIGLILLGGGIIIFITQPVLFVWMIITILALSMVIFLLEVQSNYPVFGKKWNIFYQIDKLFYQIAKFLDSFSQIIKDKK